MFSKLLAVTTALHITGGDNRFTNYLCLLQVLVVVLTLFLAQDEWEEEEPAADHVPSEWDKVGVEELVESVEGSEELNDCKVEGDGFDTKQECVLVRKAPEGHYDLEIHLSASVVLREEHDSGLINLRLNQQETNLK